MKYLLSAMIFVVFTCSSIVEGDLNTNFATSGFFEVGEDNWDYYNKGLAFKSSGFEFYHAHIKRNKDDANNIHRLVLVAESTFNPFIKEVAIIDPSLVNQKVKIVADSNGGVFIAYPLLSCLAIGVSCQQNIVVTHYNLEGIVLDSLEVKFDRGTTYLRQDDVFMDMIYMPETNRLALAVNVERENEDDTDFGIAIIDVNQFGKMNLSLNFSDDGLTTCFFDQNNTTGSADSVQSISYIKSSPYNIIIGGSVFEGNGSNNDGWNLGFCEYDQTGSQLRKWSTQSLSDLNKDQEFMQDMKFVNDGQNSLVVAANVDGLGGLDFAITKYVWDGNNTWIIDSNFGDDSIFMFRQGWNAVGFEELFQGSTNDLAQQLYLETDGSILVAGKSNWTENSNNHSRIKMVKFNQQGKIDFSWGYSGIISHALSDSLTENVVSLTENSDNSAIYMSGSHLNGSDSVSFIASFINTDVIFKSGFD